MSDSFYIKTNEGQIEPVSLPSLGAPFTGATVSSDGTVGQVPAPTSGDVFSLLRGDGTWASQIDAFAWNGTEGALNLRRAQAVDTDINFFDENNVLCGKIRLDTAGNLIMFCRPENGSDILNGARLTLAKSGSFGLMAKTETGSAIQLLGTAEGVLTWNTHTVVRFQEQGTGYRRFNSSMQMCWGSGVSGTAVTFQKAFSSAPHVILSPYQGTNMTSYFLKLATLSATSFTARGASSGSPTTQNTNLNFHWFAVGPWS